ncbi:hypothetical protein [Streptomyces anthocyanicus]|uniref:hypothetical protein n=1 Tax=Streptomyces anthocyanicus TaxID=68174 RepID=UPI003864D13E
MSAGRPSAPDPLTTEELVGLFLNGALTTPGGPMTTPDAYDALTSRRRTVITFALLGCAFLAMLDGTVVGTALPRIVEQIGGDGSWYVWFVTAYLLTSRSASRSTAASPTCTAAWLSSPCLFPPERRAAVPVLPMRLFQHRTYSALLAAGSSFRSPHCRSEPSFPCTSSTSATTRPPSPASCFSPCSSA